MKKPLIPLLVALALPVAMSAQIAVDTDRFLPVDWYAAGMADTSRFAVVGAKASYENGSFRNVFDARKILHYSFLAQGNAPLGKAVVVRGSFAYDYFDRRRQCRSMMTFVDSNPFFLADTVAGDQTSERYTLNGALQWAVLRDKLALDVDFGLFAASSAKLRDIRNRNIYSRFHFAPSIVFVPVELLKVSVAYRYAERAEEVSLTRYGDETNIYINDVEGLWFGQKLPYTSSQFPTRRYTGTLHAASARAEYTPGSVLFGGAFSWFTADDIVDAQTEEKKIGFVDNEGVTAKLFAHVASHGATVVFTDVALKAFLPLQQREYSGTTYHYIQYGKLKRYAQQKRSVTANYEFRGEHLTVDAAAQCSRLVKREFVYPQVYRQKIDNLTVAAAARYEVVLGGHAVAIAAKADYMLFDGTELAEENDAESPDYYYDEQTLSAQYQYETTDNYAISPTLEWSFDIRNLGRMTIRLNNENRFTVDADSAARHFYALSVDLRVF